MKSFTLMATFLGVTALTFGQDQAIPATGPLVSGIFGDQMVLQQKGPIPVWGTAISGQQVVVRFAGQTLSATADNGRWAVMLKPVDAGGPYDMTVESGTEKKTFRNILVGEVWFCSGQSNMLFHVDQLANAAEEMAAATNASIRMIKTETLGATVEQNDLKGTWQVCSPETVAPISAVAYLFAKELAANRKVPVGIIESSVGATVIETWTKNEGPLNEATKTFFGNNTVSSAFAGSKVLPGIYYNGMVKPVAPFAIRGFLWYQGESNAGSTTYANKMATMIGQWRALWNQGDIPFLFVQLPRYGDSNWFHTLREQQSKVLGIVANTGMAISIDTGEPKNLHPSAKQPIAHRLFLAAENLAYGNNVEYIGPQYQSSTFADGKATVVFQHVGSGLVLKDDRSAGFELCGEDRAFRPATARIVAADTLEVACPEVEAPVALRYAFKVFPDVSLFNRDDLPASPFRTDSYQVTLAQ